MIRLFEALCKSLFCSLVDAELFYDATSGFRHYGRHCPRCGARGKLSPYGDYSRWLVSLQGKAFAQLIQPLRFKCKSCGATHALLPDILIPYSPYSLRFKLAVLIAYFERGTSVVAICERFGIAVSTLYAWKALFLEHKELMLGVLLSRKEPALAFLRGLSRSADISRILQRFFDRHAFSFMQGRPKTAPRSLPP
jgi:transposase-like protein/ribosomal protein S27AE